jgi:C4-dicarboxylate transporter DctM subunit
MSEMVIGAIGMAILFLLIFFKLPIGVCMAIVGCAGVIYFAGLRAGLATLEQVPFSTIANYALASLPLFVVMGTFCHFGGVSEGLYSAINKIIGHWRGGLAMATVASCAGFAAVSASSLATVATIGKVALPEMKKYGYSDRLSTGSIAAGGTMGSLIPPSGMMIIYGIIVEVSIGRLFIAGIIPGILEAVFYMIVISALCSINPLTGPAGARTTFREKIASLKSLWSVILLFALVLGGIYFGIFSPTEAAGVGACGALLVVIINRRFSWQILKQSLIEAGSITAMVMVLMIGAHILVAFLAMSRLPFELASIIGGLQINPYFIMAAIMVIYIILGCIMDAMAMVLLTVPVLAPVVTALGFDLIWFGIIVVRATEIGAITPPIGINVFVMKDVAKDIPMSTIFKGILPFFIADLFHVTLLIAFPEIALFLPKFMKG